MTTQPIPGVRTVTTWKALARRAALWSSGVSALILAAAIVVSLSWDDLPDPIASHWGPDGRADGFASLGSYVGVFAIAGTVCILAFSAICWFWGRAAVTRRITVAVTVWIAVFLAALLLAPLSAQRGLAEASAATFGDVQLMLVFLVPLAPAILAAFLVPGDPRQIASGPIAPDAARLPLADTERAVWMRRVGGGTGLWVGATTIVLMLGIILLSRSWAMLVIPVMLGVVIATMMVFEVRVDACGLRVRSALGWPRTFVPADEVIRAEAVQVNAFREFGGWGWRTGRHGQVGVVPRSGEGLRVECTGGRTFVITVDDAAAGASLLNTMADRSRRP